MNDLKKKITLKLSSLGFDVIGITKPKIDDNVSKKYDQFLKKKFHGDMQWLEYHGEKKKKSFDDLE